MINFGSTLLKIITVIVLIYGAAEMDKNGKTLATISTSIDQIKVSMNNLQATVASISREEDRDRKDIAKLFQKDGIE
jgi:hypothetical protein